ncbi:hypothetical protein P4679_23050 [Priestia megaterium]|uniref:hypothetical protein n=1 Tax=Priestia megaterium TaxID=1404 RepID=UPI002E21B3EC|nr:hypothetical protein [Priestia megaterium]
MTTENTIITDLSGDKKEKVQKQFKAKGIPTLLSEVNFKNNAGLSDVEDAVVLNKIITSIKRVFKKDFLSKSKKEQLNYFKKLKINKSYTVEMQEYKGNNIKQKSFSRIRTQLHNRLIANHRETIPKEDLSIVKITIKSGKYTQEGFSVLNAELQPHRHRKKGDKDYYRYYDVTTLIAEVLAIQSLLSFASKSKRTLQYLFLENSFDAKTNTLSLPSKEIFKNELLKAAKKYKFNVKKTVITRELDFKKYLFNADISYNESDRLKDFKADELLLLISKEFIKESGYIQYTIDAQTKQRSSYAKSFETKKQINKNHRSASVINSFLRRYGKSEIDNDVILEKFGDTQRYFRELSETIHIPYSKEHTFRIKRLGKLRAAGVYYPHCKTTIFDRKHSYAYVHELGHRATRS